MDLLSAFTSERESLPKILRSNAETLKDLYAFMEKKRGLWQPVTWREYFERVEEIAFGLFSLGVRRGDHVLIIGDNTLELYLLELACYSLGAVTIGLSPECDVETIRTSSDRFHVRFILAQDQEQVDKVLQAISEAASEKKVVYWRYRGLGSYRIPYLIGIKEVIKEGEKIRDKEPGLIRSLIESVKPSDPFTVLFTSGTSGEPKALRHTHQGIIENLQKYFMVDPWTVRDRVVPFLPPFSLIEKWFSIGCHLLSGCTLFLPYSFQTYLKDRKEVGPTVTFLPGHAWERIVIRVKERMKRSDFLKRFIYEAFMKRGFSRRKKGLLPIIGEVLLFSPLKKHLGLSSARLCYNTGPLLNSEVLRFFNSIGTPLKNLYWTSESGFISISSGGETEAESVGFALPGIEVSISGEGEILLARGHIFRGYAHNGESEASQEGAFLTGDLGYLDRTKGLVFLGRRDDVLIGPSGDPIPTQIVESVIRMDPLLREAWVFGDGRGEGVCAVLITDDEILRGIAGEKGIYYLDPLELAKEKDVLDLLGERIRKVNEFIPKAVRISRYVVLPQAFCAEGNTVSYVRRLRKGYLKVAYRELVESLLNGMKTVRVTMPGPKREIREFPVNFIDKR